MKLFIYLTSPYSLGVRERVFKIETRTPKPTPKIVVLYNMIICFFDLLKFIESHIFNSR